jgi:hypothetical protein
MNMPRFELSTSLIPDSIFNAGFGPELVFGATA